MMTCMDTVIFALTLIKVVELGHVGRQGLLKVFWRDGALENLALMSSPALLLAALHIGAMYYASVGYP